MGIVIFHNILGIEILLTTLSMAIGFLSCAIMDEYGIKVTFSPYSPIKVSSMISSVKISMVLMIIAMILEEFVVYMSLAIQGFVCAMNLIFIVRLIVLYRKYKTAGN